VSDRTQKSAPRRGASTAGARLALEKVSDALRRVACLGLAAA